VCHLQNVKTFSGAHAAFYVRGGSFPGFKWLEREDYCSLSPTADVKNAWSYKLTPPHPTLYSHAVRSDKFIFTLQNCKKIGIPRRAKDILVLLYCLIAHDWLRELPIPRQESLNVRENSFKMITAYFRHPVCTKARSEDKMSHFSLICDRSVTIQNLAFLSYWYRQKRLPMHF
jgi:hypothetical protein